MIPYVSRTDDPEIPPPYAFPGVTIMSFRLPASLSKLQLLCDQLLNIGSLADRGFEYRAFLGFVDIEIVTYPKMMFDQQPFSNRGFASQQELYFRFYVWKFTSVGGVLFPVNVPEFFFPFIFVDNSWSMISGRSVIGFPKVITKFEPETVLGTNPFQITASALVLRTFSPTTKLDWAPIVELKPSKTTGAVNPPSGVWPWIGLGATILDPYLNELWQRVLANVPQIFSTVQLKQFRDTPDEACYQAVVATPFTPLNIRAPQPLPPVTITVNSYASLDIPGSLGFAAGVPLQPALQYSVSLDMKMSPARSVFVSK